MCCFLSHQWGLLKGSRRVDIHDLVVGLGLDSVLVDRMCRYTRIEYMDAFVFRGWLDVDVISTCVFSFCPPNQPSGNISKVSKSPKVGARTQPRIPTKQMDDHNNMTNSCIACQVDLTAQWRDIIFLDI
jgi:hypothetical protein